MGNIAFQSNIKSLLKLIQHFVQLDFPYPKNWYFHHFRWNFPPITEQIHCQIDFPAIQFIFFLMLIKLETDTLDLQGQKLILLCFNNLGESTVICKFSMNNKLVLICELSTLLQPFLNDGNITAFEKQWKNYKRVVKTVNLFYMCQETSILPPWGKKLQVNQNPTFA